MGRRGNCFVSAFFCMQKDALSLHVYVPEDSVFTILSTHWLSKGWETKKPTIQFKLNHRSIKPQSNGGWALMDLQLNLNRISRKPSLHHYATPHLSHQRYGKTFTHTSLSVVWRPTVPTKSKKIPFYFAMYFICSNFASATGSHLMWWKGNQVQILNSPAAVSRPSGSEQTPLILLGRRSLPGDKSEDLPLLLFYEASGVRLWAPFKTIGI